MRNRLFTAPSKIVRQNPESLQEKVTNFQDMVAQVRSLDMFGTHEVPVLEPVRKPGSRNFKAGNSVPILVMPMHKKDFPQVTQWLRAHEANLSGSADVVQEMTQKQLGQWLSNHQTRLIVTILSHPVERAYTAFYRHIFCSGEDLFPWIRTTLENHYGLDLPDKKLTKSPNRNVLENSGYTITRQSKAFAQFLRFLKGNLQGQTRSRIDQSWASQNSILQGYGRLAFPDIIIRKEKLATELGVIEAKLGLSPIPLPESEEPDHCFTLSEVYTPDVEKIAKAVYARDYQLFGFSDWATK